MTRLQCAAAVETDRATLVRRGEPDAVLCCLLDNPCHTRTVKARYLSSACMLPLDDLHSISHAAQCALSSVCAQVFAPEPARSAPPAERPRGAFGQRFPQNVPAAPGGAAATGAMRVQPQVRQAWEATVRLCFGMRGVAYMLLPVQCNRSHGCLTTFKHSCSSMLPCKFTETGSLAIAGCNFA